LAVSVDGKTNKRTAIARDSVVCFLWRQAQLNPRITAGDFDALLAQKLDEPVFVTMNRPQFAGGSKVIPIGVNADSG
jgi:integrase